MVVHFAAEPKHLLRLVPVELSLSLGHPALLLALQLLAEGHAERSEAASSAQARPLVTSVAFFSTERGECKFACYSICGKATVHNGTQDQS